MIYNYIDAPRGVMLWAFAYSTNKSEKSLHLKKEPVKGKIIQETYGCKFYEINKKGNVIKSKKVHIWSRTYADTYEEAIAGYNEQINEQIELLRCLMEDCKNDLISSKKGEC